ncbi:uncharacterized protein At5g39865-like [Punica granatum]|uniref:Glutaredoxin domain-containing protein n=2 Tax=Punica granatum TaxID=22663 RepID=A0A218W948_PUNGR|nr:uncharacterized protein At5g39865-like [Punica granatum]OWM68731.1 hypothetical protein CDL15_Pgr024918 [Punica granatum]PKI49889.1 hypothetical protein CRG98_029727 [Punica granatum]
MWRPWAKSTVKVVHAPSHRFSCSSFKDIQHLCSPSSSSSDDPPPPTFPSPSPSHKKLSILRRPLSFASPTLLLSDSDSAPPNPNSLPRPEPPDHLLTAPATPPSSSRLPPGAGNGIVVYYTSLRVVRPTFEACRAVQSILRGFRVRIDERDLSMDPGFLGELQRLLEAGAAGEGSRPTLPRVFIGGRYIGGAEEIRQLHEMGELKKLVEGLPAAEAGVCEVCGGNRFVLCTECNGSHKLYTEKSGFKSCTACNENGLLRCSSCCPSSSSSSSSSPSTSPPLLT